MVQTKLMLTECLHFDGQYSAEIGW